jgi:hypothetical protein
MFWLIGGGSAEAASSSARRYRRCSKRAACSSASMRRPTEFRFQIRATLPYRFQLLDPMTLQSLGSNPESIVDTALNNTLGPFGVLRTHSLCPTHWVCSRATWPRSFPAASCCSTVAHRWFTGEMRTCAPDDRGQGAFDLDDTENLLDLIEYARAWAPTQNVELFVTGVRCSRLRMRNARNSKYPPSAPDR